MHILELNEHVLRQICDYLSGSNALNLSLSSKDLYSLAIHRVAAIVTISSRHLLRRFHQTVIYDAPHRAADIHCLSIYATALRRESSSTSSSESTHRDEDSLPPQEVVDILIDLFRNTHNLHRLTLDSVHTLLYRDARLGAALASLPRLDYAHLNLVSDRVLKAVEKTGWDLRVLALYSLAYYRYIDSYPDYDMTYSILLETIAQFPHLHTLTINRFHGGYIGDPGWQDTLPDLPASSFPALRRLFIWNSKRLATLDFIDRCPNLELLDVELNETDSEEIASRALTSWPAIRSLRSSAPVSLHNVSGVHHVIELNTAEHFRIPSRISVLDPAGKDKIVVSSLVCLLRKVSPRWLQLSVAVGSTPMTFWNDVPAVAPRLRYLDLKVSMPQLRKMYADWLVRPRLPRQMFEQRD
ncbi:hypothetical protein C8Q80DRAFT_470107 [Daedaleopsis nitida]|nr:hypothetical protein C8Q80DRAFT_470107 [Daedaleopsis nitida]